MTFQDRIKRASKVVKPGVGGKNYFEKKEKNNKESGDDIALDLCVCGRCNVPLTNKFGLPFYLQNCPKCGRSMVKPIFHQLD